MESTGGDKAKEELVMRLALTALCLLICGCDLRVPKKVTKQEVTDPGGGNRLVLIYEDVSSLPDRFRGRRSSNFDSLVWRTNASGKWQDHVIISQAAFQTGSPRTRWVSQIHSLDATKATATIMVAEGDAPAGSPTVNYIYSWREWSLLTNGEIRVVRVCNSPFETYEP